MNKKQLRNFIYERGLSSQQQKALLMRYREDKDFQKQVDGEDEQTGSRWIFLAEEAEKELKKLLACLSEEEWLDMLLAEEDSLSPSKQEQQWQKILSRIEASRLVVKFFIEETLVGKKELFPTPEGEMEKLPEQIQISPKLLQEKPLALRLEQDPNSEEVQIRFSGGTLHDRRRLKVDVVYEEGDYDSFWGSEIAAGGSWTITSSQIDKIHSFEIYLHR